MGGNFSTLLWKKVTDTFACELNLPPEVLHPYMERTLENVKNFRCTADRTPGAPRHGDDSQEFKSP